jgi:hypothetical protein
MANDEHVALLKKGAEAWNEVERHAYPTAFIGTNRIRFSSLCGPKSDIATASESLPLISPSQQWHPHQRYDCGPRR